MHKGILVTLNGSPLCKAVSPAQSPAANAETGVALPRVPVSRISLSVNTITENFIEDLFEKIETANSRVSFLIHEKPMMGSIANRVEKTCANASDVDPPAQGGEIIRK